MEKLEDTQITVCPPEVEVILKDAELSNREAYGIRKGFQSSMQN